MALPDQATPSGSRIAAPPGLPLTALTALACAGV